MYHNITYLSYKKIDKAKWDQCIINAPNSLVYGMSWYLDQVCEHWDGLVMGDYEAVMPLPWKKKYGLKYIIQPLYTKILGVFGDHLSHDDYLRFYKSIPKSFFYTHLMVNYNSSSKVGVIQYVDIQKPINYNKSTRKNLRRAQNNRLIACTASSKEFLVAFQQSERQFVKDMNKTIVNRMLNNEQVLQHSLFVKVQDDNKDTLSIIWLLAFKKRLYLLTSATKEEGKRKYAKFLERDFVIRNYRDSFQYLDFVGSNIPGVYEFNRGFGTDEYHYYQLKSTIIHLLFHSK